MPTRWFFDGWYVDAADALDMADWYLATGASESFAFANDRGTHGVGYRSAAPVAAWHADGSVVPSSADRIVARFAR